MAFIRKIKASLVRKDIADYVGESTYIFYDIVTGELRIYDGTPGGMPIFVPGGGGALEVEDEGISISAAVSLINFAGTGVTVTEPGAAGEMLVTIPSGGTVWGDITGTLSDQTDLQTALDNAKEEIMFASQVDFISDDLLYRGEATPGTATSAASWRIRKITIDNPGEGDVVQIWADGNDNFDNIWDDRLILSYS